ncbi:MAG: rhodanese-like domain-containing protein [Verrucomicrobia bacterium]|nr:rhodanese-like domain-containing protein [Verrucomicrobiota bacterium]
MTAGILRRLMQETVGLLAVTTALALAVNAFSPRGIAVTRPLTLRELDARYLTAEETKARFDGGQTIFVDARRPDHFVRGHAAGALNLPAEEFMQRYIGLANWLPRETDIVVYCMGRGCYESRLLADRLAAVGYTRLWIFRDGWKAWQARGWPTEP